MSPGAENDSASPKPQDEISRDIGGGPTSSPDVMPDVLTFRTTGQASSPLHATKTQYMSCESPLSLSPIQDTSTSCVYSSSKEVPRSRNHALLDEKLGLNDQTNAYSPTPGLGKISVFLLLAALVVFLVVSDLSQSPLDITVSTMTRPFGLLHAFISVIMISVTPSQSAVPASFPPSGKVLWFRTPGASWSKNYLPIGNGFLAGKRQC